MPAASLYEIAKTRLIQNIGMLNDIGDLPYSFLAPVLRHVQVPAQLLELEQNCGQIVGETGEIWLRFIKRDIPDWEKKSHTPRDPKNWSRVYRKLKKEAEQEKQEQEEKLRETMRALQQSRAGMQTKIIESRVPIDPNAARRRAMSARSSGWGTPGAPLKTGKAAFDKLRRGMFDQKQARPKASRLPAHILAQRKTTVSQAPERLVRMKEAEASSSAVQRPSHPIPESGYSSTPKLQQNTSNAANTDKPSRTSLPAAFHLNAAKIRSQPIAPPGPQPQKRKREEPNLFMQRKRKA
ncbi:RNA polymerase II transcription factor SIII subunit A-domain-containing protein [Dendryphion nanum]|uniref:RNA polymerase II transcription factor SIII subunit A-domain-containing protein n=1 Tax=Dendryphion nanum TaxID=256645 RepID=A0A9P9IER1_9PLEO|nr:RNA polymerase II transcription factor SIII subunit A-domain-containing protein [Dendryphion nanum]